MNKWTSIVKIVKKVMELEKKVNKKYKKVNEYKDYLLPLVKLLHFTIREPSITQNGYVFEKKDPRAIDLLSTISIKNISNDSTVFLCNYEYKQFNMDLSIHYIQVSDDISWLAIINQLLYKLLLMKEDKLAINLKDLDNELTILKKMLGFLDDSSFFISTINKL